MQKVGSGGMRDRTAWDPPEPKPSAYATFGTRIAFQLLRLSANGSKPLASGLGRPVRPGRPPGQDRVRSSLQCFALFAYTFPMSAPAPSGTQTSALLARLPPVGPLFPRATLCRSDRPRAAPAQ